MCASKRKLLADKQGMVLVIALLILALLLGAGVGAIVSMQTDFRASGNLKTGTQAFYVADAGINHARQKLQNSSSSFDSVFTAANGTVIVSNNSFNNGTYTVTRQGSASNPSRIKALSVGTAPNNAQVQIEVWYRRDADKFPMALGTNGDLEISGSPNLMGVCGGAHSNEDIKVSGSPGITMAEGLTASNQTTADGGLADGMDITGTPCVGSPDCTTSSKPAANKLDTATKRDTYESGHNSATVETLPTINPADYAPKVAALGSPGYILNSDGTVTTGGTCGSDGLCSGGTSVARPTGWTFSSGVWHAQGTGLANGIFYSETKVEISDSKGAGGSPWQATIIARDSIKISGENKMEPYHTTNEDFQNTLLVTGNDLLIEGNLGADSANSAILVHQQIDISGDTSVLKGFIIAGDGKPTWTGDPFPNANSGTNFPGANNPSPTRNTITGKPSITYGCDFGCLGPGCRPPKVGIASWTDKL